MGTSNDGGTGDKNFGQAKVNDASNSDTSPADILFIFSA